jgi:hypothetical protein
MTLVLIGLCCRSDNLGVTSFVRVLNLRGDSYHRFLHLFHSKALNLDVLTSCWVRLCLVVFRPFMVGQRLVCIADGIKAPKEGKRMPAVKLLHQESQNNTKPGRVEDWRADTSVIQLHHVSSPLHIERSGRISRTTLSCVLHAKGYVTYRAGAAFDAGRRTL